MIGFLQNFDADKCLSSISDDEVARPLLEKAIEFAMLGLPEESNDICKVLADHGLFNATNAGIEFQCLWSYASLQPPDVERTSEGSIWVLSDEALQKKELEARKHLTHLPKWFNWDKTDVTQLEKMQKQAETTRTKDRFANATTGHSAMKLAAEYAAVLHMASTLGRSDVIVDVMPVMVERIHANQQARYLAQIPALWKDYFLSGWLREELGVSKQAIRKYANSIIETARKRFEQGPQRPRDLYAKLTISELLDVLNKNTVSGEGYAEWLMEIGEMDEDEEGDGEEEEEEEEEEDGEERRGEDGDVAQKRRTNLSIMRPGATPEEIEAAEQQMGHPLPADLKTFFKLSNGCGPVREYEKFFRNTLVPLDGVFFEKEDYMSGDGGYALELLPRLPGPMLKDSPGISHGAIAMYEHDGQGTHYVWIVGAKDIRVAKEHLLEFYETLGDDDKKMVDRYIEYWYGSREAFDKLTEGLYYEQMWGEPALGVYPNFHAYLAEIVYRSRQSVIESPIKLAED